MRFDLKFERSRAARIGSISTTFRLAISQHRRQHLPNTLATPPPSEHLTMGNPSNAVTNVLVPDNYLMEKPQYSISYNRDRGESNWVSWHLSIVMAGQRPKAE